MTLNDGKFRAMDCAKAIEAGARGGRKRGGACVSQKWPSLAVCQRLARSRSTVRSFAKRGTRRWGRVLTKKCDELDCPTGLRWPSAGCARRQGLGFGFCGWASVRSPRVDYIARKATSSRMHPSPPKRLGFSRKVDGILGATRDGLRFTTPRVPGGDWKGRGAGMKADSSLDPKVADVLAPAPLGAR